MQGDNTNVFPIMVIDLPNKRFIISKTIDFFESIIFADIVA